MEPPNGLNLDSQNSPEKPGEPKPEQSLIVLSAWPYMDEKIDKMGQAPRLMETVKDEAGNILIRKYEKLNKAIWKKYRTKPECRPLHFISEIPLWVIEDINTTFLLPEDFEFLGACFAQTGNSSGADQFFNEAMKTGFADAYINAGVFRYKLGERGVIDNFKLARNYFNKALGILHLMPLSVDDKYKRRKLCTEAIDEIEYRFASFLDKFFKFIIRMLTFHFDTYVFYVGAAAPVDPPARKLAEMTDGILKKEFNLKIEATRKFIGEVQGKIPVAQAHLEEELNEIMKDYGEFRSPEILDTCVQRLGEFYIQNKALLERHAPAAGPAGEKDTTELSIDDLAFQIAGYEEIERVGEKFKLRSVGELVDMASSSRIENSVIAWLFREKMDVPEVMARLAKNPKVPEDMKIFIRHRHPFSPDNTESS